MSFCKLALFMFILAVPARAESTEEMLSSCRSVAEAKVVNGSIDLPQDFATGACWGAFSTVQSAIFLALGKDKTLALHVCAPLNVSRTQLIALFVDYARRNPKRLNEEFFYVTLDALWAAFPCPSK
jgi:hypothetical protein